LDLLFEGRDTGGIMAQRVGEIIMYPSNSFERVREFMLKFKHPVFDKPQLIPDEGWEQMRLGLIREEFCELLDALSYGETADAIRAVPLEADRVERRNEPDVVAAADALGDLEYVTNGMALGMGIDLPAVVKEIHRSNMTKLGEDGEPIFREDGKVLKGPNYEPPNLPAVLGL
jgi:predicted HAD superfamily Cof-like phosphohydrolase